MTNNNVHQSRNTLNNSAKSTSRVKLNMYGGVLKGNIITEPIFPPPPPPPIVCEIDALDFSCADNSEYIGVI